MTNGKRGFVVPLLLAIIAILVAGGVYFAMKNKSTPANVGSNIITTKPTKNNISVSNSDSYTYTNSTSVAFQFQYPKDYQIYSRVTPSPFDAKIANMLSVASANPNYIFLGKSGLGGKSFTEATLHIEVNTSKFATLDDFQNDLAQSYQSDFNRGAIKSLPNLTKITTASGEMALKLSDSKTGQVTAYYLLKNNTLVDIEPAYYTPYTSEDKKVLSELVDTFKFTSATTTTIPNTIQPSITVLSPNGGETYKVGSKVKITWNDQNGRDREQYNIVLNRVLDPSVRADAGITTTIGANITVGSSGIDGSSSYEWAIPNSMFRGKYIIEIHRAVALNLYGKSAEFTITD